MDSIYIHIYNLKFYFSLDKWAWQRWGREEVQDNYYYFLNDRNLLGHHWTLWNSTEDTIKMVLLLFLRGGGSMRWLQLICIQKNLVSPAAGRRRWGAQLKKTEVFVHKPIPVAKECWGALAALACLDLVMHSSPSFKRQVVTNSLCPSRRKE